MTDVTQNNLEEMARLTAEAEARVKEAVQFARDNGLSVPEFEATINEVVEDNWDASYDWDASYEWDSSYC